MKYQNKWAFALCLGVSSIIASTSIDAQTETAATKPASIDAKEAEAIATEAYIYAYPLVTMDITKDVMTNVVAPDHQKAPMGQFANLRAYPNAYFKDITTPNADTLYSSAWLDLAKEPYILHVPDEVNRYYLLPMLSGWTEVFADPGTRTTGTKAGDFVIVGPNWKGALPPGLEVFKSTTDLVWILGRTYSDGTLEDYMAVHEIQDKYSLTPLSSYGKDYRPPQGKINKQIDTRTPVRDQVNNLNGVEFFNRFAKLLVQNPPQSGVDDAMVTKLAKLGIVAGKEFNLGALDAQVKGAIAKAPKSGQAAIVGYKKDAGEVINGWLYPKDPGHYGTDYLRRAFVIYFGIGANLMQDAVYPNADSDANGNPLEGSKKYVLHFEKGELPPVKGFWSLTMYNDQYYFVDNPLNRYTLSPRDPLKYNEDGSLDLYIQNKSPGQEKDANWLPAPDGKFVLVFRFYWPEEAILNGTWKPPMIESVD